ncbi:hypothetical protein Q7P36_009517 [Cladosporium allicinum]
MNESYLGATCYMDAAVAPELVPENLQETYRLLIEAMPSRLPKDWIRICPVRMDSSDDIRIWIWPFATQGIPKAPDYDALSYVCGEGEYDQEIVVNHSRLMIKSGLMAALKDYKRTMNRIDNFLYDEEDLVEKSEQIQRMHHIYRGAESVLVSFGSSPGEHEPVALVCQWLHHALRCYLATVGVDSVLGDQTIGGIEHDMLCLARKLERRYSISAANLGALRSMAEAVTQWSTRTHYPDLWTLYQGNLPDLAHIFNDHGVWTSCIQVFEHEWFSRGWTFQELQIGRTTAGHVNFSLGNRWIDWMSVRTLRSIAALAVYSFGSQGLSPEELVSRNRLFARSPQQELEWFRPLHGRDGLEAGLITRIDLFKMLRISARRRATVKKDHVYGLLGLMAPELRERFSIDYSASDAEVFVRALKAGMRVVEGRTDFVLPELWEQLARISPTTVGLPSWCPDLSNGRHSSTAPLGVRSLSRSFREAYLTFAHFEFLDEDLLRLRLVPLGIIARSVHTSCPALDLETYLLPTTKDIRKHFCGPASVSAWMQHLVDFPVAGLAAFLWLYSRKSKYPDESSDPRENEVICGAINHDYEASPPACKCVTCLMRLIFSIVFLHGFFDGNRHSPQSFTGVSGQHATSFTEAAFALTLESGYFGRVPGSTRSFRENEQKESLDYLDRVLVYTRDVLHCLQGMYIFQTTKGQFGCSPRRPSAGDVITVVPGGEFLHIISEDGRRYVGAASVQGYMGDSLLRHVKELGDNIEELTLQ